MSAIRTGKSYLKKKDELQAMGFNYLVGAHLGPCLIVNLARTLLHIVYYTYSHTHTDYRHILSTHFRITPSQTIPNQPIHSPHRFSQVHLLPKYEREYEYPLSLSTLSTTHSTLLITSPYLINPSTLITLISTSFPRCIYYPNTNENTNILS